MEKRKKIFIALGVLGSVLVLSVVLGLIPLYLRSSSKDKCKVDLAKDKISPTDVILVGINELGFNKAGTAIQLKLTCPILDANNYTVLVNGKIQESTSNTSDSIVLSNYFDGLVRLSLFAFDTHQLPIFASFQIYFGSINMTVSVLDADNKPVKNVNVNISLTDDVIVSQKGNTNENGILNFLNVPSTTVSLFAYDGSNQIALSGIAPSYSEVILRLIPFDEANKRTEVQNRQYLSVTTQGLQLQTISRSFIAEQNVTDAFIEYQFVTSEVPGGFFGSRYNDYFSVTLRSSKGTVVTKTDSMNGLGLGAFDYSTGATSWTKLALKAGPGDKVRFDVGVANVGDDQYQSMVNVRSYGFTECSRCEADCTKCSADPMCTDLCQNPPEKSCAFYLSCMETKIPCGNKGYAVNYGYKYCTKFSKNLELFTSQGALWMWKTMRCLQTSLVKPLTDCKQTCSGLRSIAFASHPNCYVENGICSLSPSDWKLIMVIVGKDMLTFDGLVQALKTAPQCIPNIIQWIVAEISIVESKYEKIILQTLKKWFESL